MNFRFFVPIFLFAAPAVAQPIDCVIEPARVIDLGGLEEGRLEERLVGRGDLVKAGDLVARLDNELERLAVEATQYRASDDVATRSNEERLRFQDLQINRFSKLAERQVTSQLRLEEIEIERDLAALAADASRLEFEIVKVEAKNAQAMLERRFIRSPINGVVVRTELSEGELVTDQSVIMTIADTSTLHVETFMPVALYRDLAIGDKATVTVPSPLDLSLDATIAVIDKVFDAASGTFGVRLLVQNPDLSVPAGLRCQLVFDQLEGANDK